MSNLTAFAKIEKEFRCDSEGKGFVSLRGLARMCGVRYQSWGRGDSYFTKEIDEYLSEQGIEVTAEILKGGIPDVIASEVIGFYAYKGNKTAQQFDRAFRAIGLRGAIQNVVGYKPRPKLTVEEIIELCCLPVPTIWQRRFPEEFYNHLSRLTNLVAEGHHRPLFWAQLTKELVYDYLPPGIYAEIKRCKKETGSYDKLHQFLSSEGILILETHQRRVLEHMQGAATLQQLQTSLRQACTGQYQLVLLGG